MKELKFRVWEGDYMIYQGSPDVETLQSFIFHHGEKELMQYTGFRDCMGKDIYFGDIYYDKSHKRSREVDDLTVAYWMIEKDNIMSTSNVQPIKIMGNIHQNRELLNENTNS